MHVLHLHGFLLPSLCAATALAALALPPALAALVLAPALASAGLQAIVRHVLPTPAPGGLQLTPAPSLLLAAVAAGLLQALLYLAGGLVWAVRRLLPSTATAGSRGALASASGRCGFALAPSCSCVLKASPVVSFQA